MIPLRRLDHRLFVSLLLTATLAIGGAFWAVARFRPNPPEMQELARLARQVQHEIERLPDDDDQPQRLRQLGKVLNADLSIFSESGELLFSVGQAPPATDRGCQAPGPRPGGPWQGLCLPVGEAEWLLVRPSNHHRWFMFAGALVLLALCMALASWPVARSLTRRLENLRRSVQAFGGGDLRARATVGGHDEIAEVAKEFNAAADRISELIAGQRHTLASASHELRSPLSRLRMLVELMADGNGDPRELRTKAAEQIRLLDELIDELLTASRLDTGLEIPRRFVSLELSEWLVTLCKSDDVKLSLPDRCTIEADPKLLERLIGNLLRNARKWGAPPIEISLTTLRDEIHIDIRDHGAGIAPADVSKIFLPFYRPANHDEGRDGSVGYGLALCRRIARHHGGDLVHVVPKDGGAGFRVTLPRSQPIVVEE